MNLIYQYWDGPVRESCQAGVNAMKKYAKSIGAEYLFEENPNWLRSTFKYDFGNYSPHYGAFKPVYDESFDKYDKIMFVDTDVFPVDGLKENIFDEFTGEIGICTEPEQSRIRTITRGRITHDTDERWGEMLKNMFNTQVPRDRYGIIAYNTGVVLYSKEGRVKAREKFQDFKQYVDTVRRMGLDSFYTCDQPYLHAQMFIHNMDVQDMDNGWNSYVHYAKIKGNPELDLCDWRTKDTKMVHVQLMGADSKDTAWHWNIVNMPQNMWNLD